MDNLFYYLIGINIIAFLVYGLDKLLAKLHSWRIPEVTLLLLAAIGGSGGAYLAMQCFRHKTLHWKFKLGVPALFILQVVAYFYLKA